MADSLAGFEPPDDSGSDAFTRFRYQAHLAFGWCLTLFFGEGARAVVAEHFEDLLVESDHELRFVGIKTRDPELGPWRLRHLLDVGGALRSFLRTHRALEGVDDGRRIVYDIRLEGAALRGDEIARLAPGGDGSDDRIAKECADRLGCQEPEARALLARIEVHAGQPLRQVIEDLNVSDLGRIAGQLTASQLREVYREVIALIERAMAADLLADAWPRAIIGAQSARERSELRAQGKRIDREMLTPLLGQLDASDHLILSEITDQDRLRATALERKLRTQGASEALITEAKQFRAQASHRLFEFQNSSLASAAAVLSDLEIRLLAIARTTAAAAAGVPPGPAIWRAVHERIEAAPHHHDPRGILQQEPLLLMGAICQYSDECKFGWSTNG